MSIQREIVVPPTNPETRAAAERVVVARCGEDAGRVLEMLGLGAEE